MEEDSTERKSLVREVLINNRGTKSTRKDARLQTPNHKTLLSARA